MARVFLVIIMVLMLGGGVAWGGNNGSPCRPEASNHCNPPGRQLIDEPYFPAASKPEASKGRDFLAVLRGVEDLDWTYLSPSASFAPGERTGHYRVGADDLLVDASGKSAISMEDYAIAVLDELEHPKHVRQRFTVGN